MGTLKVDEIRSTSAHDDANAITLSGNNATLTSNVVFPTGHIINMASYSTRATSSLSAANGGADFSATNIDITVKNASSKMIINLFSKVIC